MSTKKHNKKYLKNKKTKNYNKLRKSRKSRNRKSKLSKRKFSKKNKNRKGGGFNKGACPFVGEPWNATGPAYFYKHAKNGIGPGGIPVYPRNNSQLKQRGGRFLQPLINLFRVGEVGTSNVVNRYKGLRLQPSPLPMYDQFKRRNYN